MSKQALRNRRKPVEEVKPPIKEKFLREIAIEQQCPKLEAKSANQKLALAMMKEGRSVIFLTGSAGTGKSMLAAYHAATQLKMKKIDKVYLVRPAVSVGKSIGLLPGEIEDKLSPYFAQTLNHLAKFMGHGYLKYCLENKIIEFKPSEFMRGMSFEKSILIVEECQNYTKEEFEMILTRMGEDSMLLMTGDSKQHDLRGVSGLEQTIDLLMKMEDTQPYYLSDEDLDEMTRNIGIVRFTQDDVVRSGLTRALVKMYHNN